MPSPRIAIILGRREYFIYYLFKGWWWRTAAGGRGKWAKCKAVPYGKMPSKAQDREEGVAHITASRQAIYEPLMRLGRWVWILRFPYSRFHVLSLNSPNKPAHMCNPVKIILKYFFYSEIIFPSTARCLWWLRQSWEFAGSVFEDAHRVGFAYVCS